ncbi:MAG: glycine cleavage system protein GcvH [Deltaproteobacteria bacterium]|nr:glycine cleavage system protein GcvH [Deltaproteobacteria bacterium]
MKDISELKFPENVRYTKDHEWARQEGDIVIAGISDYAQDQLGDVVYVELPPVGDRFENGDVFGTVESVKAVSEMFIPVAGEVVAINAALSDTPDVVNADPYGAGWMIHIKPSDPTSLETLMTR